jgi:hypothetical protein
MACLQRSATTRGDTGPPLFWSTLSRFFSARLSFSVIASTVRFGLVAGASWASSRFLISG